MKKRFVRIVASLALGAALLGGIGKASAQPRAPGPESGQASQQRVQPKPKRQQRSDQPAAASHSTHHRKPRSQWQLLAARRAQRISR